MGTISILIGVIVFCGFILAGAKIAELILRYMSILAMSVTSLETVSDTALVAVVVAFFSFIGFLIGMNLVMHGLTLKKIAKLTNQLKRMV